MRTDLTAAMKKRDTLAVGVLRSALGAIDNAEAVDVSLAPRPDSGVIAGAVRGLHSAEVGRRELTDAEILDIVRAEIVERRAAADDYHARGHQDHAARLRAEADVLHRYVMP